MCGIYGIVGKTNTNEVLDSLERLEYRGYDSCGLAYIYKNKSFLFKTIGNTSKLRQTVEYKEIYCAIGHTRWATHGAVTPINAHPHTSDKKRFFVVHNGVIDNYLELKKKYGFTFESQTDTEIIVHLLDYYTQTLTTLETIKILLTELTGSFAVVIIDKTEENKLYFFKNKSPLLIALDNKKIVLASDQCVFDNKMNVTILNDRNYGYILKDNYRIFSLNENERWNTFYKDYNTKIDKINEYYMLDEMMYEPTMILDIAKQYSKIDTAEFLNTLNYAKEIVFVGAGSSYYAGCILSRFFEQKLKKRCYSIIASELQFFSLLHRDILFIFLSQSGETADLCECLTYLKNNNYKIISLCNNVNSSLGYNSDMIFPLFAKSEIAVASTKALTAMIYVGRILLEKEYYCKHAGFISKQLEKVFTKWEQINQISNAISLSNIIFYLGKGVDYSIALEGALKLREISYLSAFAFQSGELKHGSIALIDRRCVCVLILTDISLKVIVKSNLEEARSRGAKTFYISNCDTEADLYLEGDILNIILCLQIIAYQTALILNRNIDQPRNLAKSVTVL